MRVVMMGTGTFAEPTFAALLASAHQVVGLVTQPDRVVGQERGSTRLAGASLKQLALAKNVPVLQPENINTPEGAAALAALQPEILVVAAYGQILAKEVLGSATRGGINVHASLLPKYRGAAPIAWAIYHGETQAGVTIIRMSLSLDAGEMLAQEAVTILPHETAGELETRLAPLGAELALRVLTELATGTARGVVQDKALVTKAPKLTKQLGEIVWTRPAEQVCCQVRAMHPWPTAYTYWHTAGKAPVRLILFRTEASSQTTNLVPGEVTVGPNSELWVAAGQGSVVEVKELQPAGKKRMSARDFLRGNQPKPGDLFGPEVAKTQPNTDG